MQGMCLPLACRPKLINEDGNTGWFACRNFAFQRQFARSRAKIAKSRQFNGQWWTIHYRLGRTRWSGKVEFQILKRGHRGKDAFQRAMWQLGSIGEPSGSLAAIALHERQHVLHCLRDAGKHGATDDAVANVQFFQMRHDVESLQIFVVQAVTGIDVKAEFIRHA